MYKVMTSQYPTRAWLANVGRNISRSKAQSGIAFLQAFFASCVFA